MLGMGAGGFARGQPFGTLPWSSGSVLIGAADFRAAGYWVGRAFLSTCSSGGVTGLDPSAPTSRE